MKSKPIIFSTESIVAILEGRKSMTRRVIRPQPEESGELLKKPAYLIGDRLWVRERWRLRGWDWDVCECLIQYSDGMELWKAYPAFRKNSLDAWEDWVIEQTDRLLQRNGESPEPNSEFGFAVKITDDDPWQSPIFMPKWASRITLEVTMVRAERLKSIMGSGDVEKEGFISLNGNRGFAQTWNNLNAKRGFDYFANPFVWVYEFRRVKP